MDYQWQFLCEEKALESGSESICYDKEAENVSMTSQEFCNEHGFTGETARVMDTVLKGNDVSEDVILKIYSDLMSGEEEPSSDDYQEME